MLRILAAAASTFQQNGIQLALGVHDVRLSAAGIGQHEFVRDRRQRKFMTVVQPHNAGLRGREPGRDQFPHCRELLFLFELPVRVNGVRLAQIPIQLTRVCAGIDGGFSQRREAVIACNCVEPCRECRVAPEGVAIAEGSKINALSQILGAVPGLREPPTPVQDPRSIAGMQLAENKVDIVPSFRCPEPKH